MIIRKIRKIYEATGGGVILSSNTFNLKEYSQRSRFTDTSVIEGPDIKSLNPTKLQMIKFKLEQKYPKINWTVETVMEWINDNLLHKIPPFDKPKDLFHGD